ncbi:DUF2786 domain-containing protein [Acidimicrobiia bacterium EGI L10123]|uniref:DUF2786 domain-containing protein n=1 Tax=Salinilacustrithrix flava TaxID=2957203 RepID=UPI003D7C28AF|nr:DUF2786 domain-containing protein [Acidimicrobiia bacterium EGI L10123]
MAHLDPDGAGGGAPDPGVLHKVRSLLAKAESTTYPDEAEALSAKAQQLMDRHAIDRAMLGEGSRAGPEGRTLLVESPYARPKFQLLTELARANRCRAVLDTDRNVATVIGFPDDQATVELLYTSLLVQGTRAMLQAGTSPRTRSRAFRQAFLVAYASRIGQRLRQAAAATVSEAVRDHGEGLLPVLRSREVAVEDELASAFPHLRRMRVTASDPAGYAAGHAAADRARLGGQEVRGRVRRLRR